MAASTMPLPILSIEPSQRRTNSSLERELVLVIEKNRWNKLILARADQLGITDWWLTSGCIAQSVWNVACGREIDAGILDYDLIYYDSDTSWEAEDVVIRKARSLFADLPIEVQVRNQARVPLWYQAKFGIPFGTVMRASDGIDRFPCATVAVGVKRLEEQFEIYSPFGLASLFDGHLRPNKALPIREVYEAKTDRWRREWPHLSFERW
ncbi:Nucleotidyltransferase family protein [Pararobbsia alpina]|uniref:nucleotidyltransferase family protein n=1 Tax=Pararobbsia alpina TaxID=621374 RepID=UPI0039A437DE